MADSLVVVEDNTVGKERKNSLEDTVDTDMNKGFGTYESLL